MKRYFAFLAFLFCAVALQPARYATAAATATVRDQAICKGTAAASGGTFTCDFAIPTDRAASLIGRVGFSDFASSHLHDAGFVTCEYVVENKNGTLSAPAAITSSNNPSTSANLVGSRAEASDSAFVNAGGGQNPSCTWSISGTNARLTFTNQSVTSVVADVTVWIQAFEFGSQ